MAKKQTITKEQIIKACARVMGRIGLENATVDDVAKEAGIAKGSIYIYFNSKDDIFSEAIKLLASERILILKSLLLPYSSATKQLEVLLNATQTISKKDPESFLMNYALLLSTHKNLRKKSAALFFKSYIDLVTSIVNEGIARQELKKVNPEVLAFLLIIASDMYQILHYLDPKMIEIPKLTDELLRLVKNLNLSS